MKAFIFLMIAGAKFLNPRYWFVSTNLIYAQAKHETGNFTSSIFKNNNNLFGMKLAKKRSTTAIGEKSGHAVYKTLFHSVLDYFKRQKEFNISGSSNTQFVNDTIHSGYAEDPAYLEKWMALYRDDKSLVFKVLPVLTTVLVLFITHLILKKWLNIDIKAKVRSWIR